MHPFTFNYILDYFPYSTLQQMRESFALNMPKKIFWNKYNYTHFINYSLGSYFAKKKSTRQLMRKIFSEIYSCYDEIYYFAQFNRKKIFAFLLQHFNANDLFHIVCSVGNTKLAKEIYSSVKDFGHQISILSIGSVDCAKFIDSVNFPKNKLCYLNALFLRNFDLVKYFVSKDPNIYCKKLDFENISPENTKKIKDIINFLMLENIKFNTECFAKMLLERKNFGDYSYLLKKVNICSDISI